MTPTLVDLVLPSPGFYNFISSWIFEHRGLLFVVDPGPTNSLPILYEALGNRAPDYILLTHIHVDHAGGIGALSENFPQAKIVAFEKAHRHLIDPSRLIEASNKNVGSLMDLYGPIESVSEIQIVKDIKLVEEVKIVPTPGHAPHHISFIIDKYIFCGEALGIRYPLEKGNYIRPACPPVFDRQAYLQSVDRLESIYDGHKFCFGHYGVEERNKELFKIARDQIKIWQDVVSKHAFQADEDVSEESYLGLLEILIERDPNFSLFYELPEDVQQREKIFIINSIRGLKN